MTHPCVTLMIHVWRNSSWYFFVHICVCTHMYMFVYTCLPPILKSMYWPWATLLPSNIRWATLLPSSMPLPWARIWQFMWTKQTNDRNKDGQSQESVIVLRSGGTCQENQTKRSVSFSLGPTEMFCTRQYFLRSSVRLDSSWAGSWHECVFDFGT